MLTREQNERITRVGPGTPMGAVFRQFWLPVCTSRELPAPDSDPLRVRLVGEALVAFRDSTGQVGLLQEHCPHRGASLALGRVEDGGLRCLYHGWKFSTSGKTLDMPNCSSKAIQSRMSAKSYPVHEDGGLVWAYLGNLQTPPAFTRYAFMDAPDTHRAVVRVNVDCNYLQLTEGGFDSSHVGILHSDVARPGWMDASVKLSSDVEHPGTLASDDNDPELDIAETDFGFYYAAFRDGGTDERGQDRLNVRVVPFMMPSTRIIPSPTTQYTVFETPADDAHTSTFIVVHGKQPVERAKVIKILGLDKGDYWNDQTNQFKATWADRFGQDRASMKSAWTGFKGLEQEDAIISLSMGPIFDRSTEHLVAADRAVASLRRALLSAADRVHGGETLTLPPDLTDVGAPDVFLGSQDQNTWKGLTPNHYLDSPESENLDRSMGTETA